MEFQTGEVGPKIELVTGPLAAEAVKEMPSDVGRECVVGRRFSRLAAAGKRARAAPLLAITTSRLVADEEEHAANRNPLSNGRVVKTAHDLAESLCLVDRLVFFCSARCFR